MAGIGALGERIILDERAVVAVPSRVPAELAAVLGCAIVTGLGSVLNEADDRPGERVAVIGCGGIGMAIVQSTFNQAIRSGFGQLPRARAFG